MGEGKVQRSNSRSLLEYLWHSSPSVRWHLYLQLRSLDLNYECKALLISITYRIGLDNKDDHLSLTILCLIK